LYPDGLGALRNLAFVEKNLGLIASAARNFRELTRRAPLDPNPARRPWADFARKEYEALAPRVPLLTIKVERRPEGLELSLDGEPLPAAAWETPLELDPGTHTVKAEAPGYQVFEQTVEVAAAAEDDLAIELEEKPAAAEAPEPAANGPPEKDAAPRSSSKLAPLIVGGVGGATLGVGLALGYVAIKKRQSACGDSRFCEPTELESGRSVARAATVVTVVGGVTIAGALVWYLLAPSGSENETALMPDISNGHLGLTTAGTF
jgi:hypothetical protein